MLDQKIENGPDYDSNSETEIAIEEARQIELVHHWESASLSASMCSSTSRSLQNTPVRQAPLKYANEIFRKSIEFSRFLNLILQQPAASN